MIMIDKHYNLSCYVLEHPYQAYYSQDKDMIELIDVNNEIYQFRLPDNEHYEKVVANWKVIKYFRIYGTAVLLYQTNQLCISNNEDKPCIIENVQDVTVLLTPKGIHLLLKPVHLQGTPMFLEWVTFIMNEQTPGHRVQINRCDLENSYSEGLGEKANQHHFFSKIQKVMGRFCLFQNALGGYSLGKLIVECYHHGNPDKVLKYELLHHIEFPERLRILGSFRDTFIFTSLQQTSSQTSTLYFFDPLSEHHTVKLKDFHSKTKNLDYFLYEQYLMFIETFDLLIFETVTGSLMAKVNLTSMVEQFQAGSSLILGFQHQKQSRYYLLFDETIPNITHCYLMDKEKISIYHANISELLNVSFRTLIRQKMTSLQNDNEEIHQNILKTVNFRTKKLETLEEYVNEGGKTFSYGNVYRFLQNEQNIFVLSDGLFLLFNSLSNNSERILKEKMLVLQLEREMLQIITKLVNESKYEHHISRGLTIANTLFLDFRTKNKVLQKQDNIQFYLGLLSSKRVSKLLRQDKNKKLFQLCYQLAIGVKGYDYLEEIQRGKNNF